MSVTFDPWPIRLTCEVQPHDEELVALAKLASQSWLDSLSGERWGTGTAVERYVPNVSSSCLPHGAPTMMGTHWIEGGSGQDCCSLPLERSPIRQVIRVTERGVVLARSSYRVQSGSLIRVGGCWPSGDACSEPPVEVEYRFGRNVPPLGAAAHGQFTCEVLKAYKGERCKLPTQVLTSVTRQGVSGQKQLSADGKAELADNLPLVKMFLDATNPNRLRRAPRVLGPTTGGRV